MDCATWFHIIKDESQNSKEVKFTNHGAKDALVRDRTRQPTLDFAKSTVFIWVKFSLIFD